MADEADTKAPAEEQAPKQENAGKMPAEVAEEIDRRKKAEQAIKNIHALAQFGVLALSTEEGKAAIKKAQDTIRQNSDKKEEMAKGVTDAIIELSLYAYDLISTRVQEDLEAAFSKIPADEVTTEKLSNAMVAVCGDDFRKLLFAKDLFVRIAVKVFGPDVMKELDRKAKEELMSRKAEQPPVAAEETGPAVAEETGPAD